MNNNAETTCYIAKAIDKGVAYLGLKENEYYILVPCGDDTWMVYGHGKYIGTGKTCYFEILSFKMMNKPVFNIGDEVDAVVILNDLSSKWIKGIIKDIEISNFFNSYYYTIEDKENNEIYNNIWEYNIKFT